MYQPAHFAETRLDVLHQLIRTHPLSTLVTLDDDGTIQADPVPLMRVPGPTPAGTLRGHVARANPLWRRAGADREVLAVFQGPQAYVSPSGYPSKREHGKVVPTWNYVVVQARGRLRAIEDAAALHALVSGLTDRFEAPRDAPWQVGDAPAAYIDTMLRAIVGIEIDVASLVGKWKLSQNRSEADRLGVARVLREDGARDPASQAGAVARLVERPDGGGD